MCTGASGNYGVETCSAAGQWGAATACTGQTPLCSNGACAPCTGGTSACSNTCVNEQTDPGNCGTCNHPCQGGTCAGGICQPVTLVSTSNGSGGHIAIDSGNVYWESKGQILSCPVSGNCGMGTVVYTTPSGWDLYGLALPSPGTPYDGFLYVGNINTDGLNQVPYVEQVNKSTLAVKTIALSSSISNPVELAFDSFDTWLYVTDSGNNALERFKPDGSQYNVVLSSVTSLPGVLQTITIDTSNVYVSDFGGSVRFCPLGAVTCGAGSVALSGLGLGLKGIFSDGARLWAADSVGEVYECAADHSCGTPTPVAAGQVGALSVVADANYVYWANNPLQSTSQIMRCPVTGCAGNPLVYVSGINAALSWMLALDDDALYWTDTAGVHKVAK